MGTESNLIKTLYIIYILNITRSGKLWEWYVYKLNKKYMGKKSCSTKKISKMNKWIVMLLLCFLLIKAVEESDRKMVFHSLWMQKFSVKNI